MRIANITVDGERGLGSPDGQGGVRWLPSSNAHGFVSVDALIANDASWRDVEAAFAAASVRPEDVATFDPVIRRPGKVVCIGLNYRDHTAESPYEQPDYPTVFTRVTTSLCGHAVPLLRPSISDSFDFEGEMAVVIGRGGRHISRASALSHVAGYSVFNDGSVREYQFKSPQWTVGKNFDGTGAFGPYLVTADELPPGGKGLQLTTRLNGEVVQQASTTDMVFPVDELIAVLSEAMTLEPGDVIVSGTPAGIGWARDPKLLMQDGDVCEVEIEGVGLLRNPVVEAEAARRDAA